MNIIRKEPKEIRTIDKIYKLQNKFLNDTKNTPAKRWKALVSLVGEWRSPLPFRYILEHNVI
jgi:hypothetical protein